MKPRELQLWFLADIQTRTARLAPHIIPGGKLEVKQALAVYQNGYIARLHGALRENFPALWYVLGDSKFEKLCAGYRAQYPSTSHNLNDYGALMPQFLKANYPKRVDLYYLGLFEILILEVFNATEILHPPLAFDGIDAQKSKFSFQPGVRLFESPFATYTLWKNRNKRKDALRTKNPMGPEFTLIYKRNHDLYFSALTGGQYRILGRLLKRQSIAKALSGIAANPAEVSALFSLIATPGVAQSVAYDSKQLLQR